MSLATFQVLFVAHESEKSVSANFRRLSWFSFGTLTRQTLTGGLPKWAKGAIPLTSSICQSGPRERASECRRMTIVLAHPFKSGRWAKPMYLSGPCGPSLLGPLWQHFQCIESTEHFRCAEGGGQTHQLSQIRRNGAKSK